MKSSEVKYSDPKKSSTTENIKKEYASAINALFSTNDTTSKYNAIKQLKQYDSRLLQMGMRATIKIGVEKIE